MLGAVGSEAWTGTEPSASPRSFKVRSAWRMDFRSTSAGAVAVGRKETEKYRGAKTFRREWPSSGAAFLHDGRVPEVGEVTRLPDLGPHLPTAGRSREGGAEARRPAAARRYGRSHDYFYKGPIARQLVRFSREFKIRDNEGGTPLRSIDRGGFRRLRSPDPGALELRLPRVSGLQVRTLDPGARLPSATGATGRLRPGGAQAQQRRLPPPLAGDGQAGPRRQGEVLRRIPTSFTFPVRGFSPGNTPS